MKTTRSFILAASIVLAMVITGCGVPRWDKNAAEESTLYLDDTLTITKLDGAGNFVLYADKTYKGTANVRYPNEPPKDKEVKKMKPVLKIPAGTRTVTVKQENTAVLLALKGGDNTKDVSYDFIPGRHYLITIGIDSENLSLKNAVGDAIGDISGMKVHVYDITDQKK